MESLTMTAVMAAQSRSHLRAAMDHLLYALKPFMRAYPDSSAAFERSECPKRPKGMRQKTYEKLRAKYERLQRSW